MSLTIDPIYRHSNLTISLDIQSLAKQLPACREITPSRIDQPHRLNYQQTITSEIRMVTSEHSLSNTFHMAWTSGNGLGIQLYNLSGKRRKRSFVLQVIVARSYVIKVQSCRPICSPAWSLPFSISTRNLVPANAPILEACRNGDSERVRLLLKSRIARPDDITPDSETPLSVSPEAIPHWRAKLNNCRLQSKWDAKTLFISCCKQVLIQTYPVEGLKCKL